MFKRRTPLKVGKPTLGDVVLVVWHDANIVALGDSIPLEYALDECALIELRSVGFYVGANKQYLTIAMESQPHGGVRDLMTIPIGDVQVVRVLAKQKEVRGDVLSGDA